MSIVGKHNNHTVFKGALYVCVCVCVHPHSFIKLTVKSISDPTKKEYQLLVSVLMKEMLN